MIDSKLTQLMNYLLDHHQVVGHTLQWSSLPEEAVLPV